ncbi:hypothetical protein ACFSM5_09300 [Lacibacterium aquatile]|uniref:Uncharacterized protein n=1 Tax=Lacibacterium aquatile TaxID=1168082 RepID=A0ABW5DV05_9PROT
MRTARLVLLTLAVGLLPMVSLAQQDTYPTLRAPKGVTHVVRTPLPNWQVGDIDKALSKLCSVGQFNQKVPFKYSGSFTGPNGSALVGGAKGTGLNLFDPFKKAKADRDYWFHRDRTSNCIVYWARVKPGQTAPAGS